VIFYIAGALVLYLLLSWRLAYTYIHPPRESVLAPGWINIVSIPSPRGSIPAWASPQLAQGHGKPVVFVLVYGYGGTREAWQDEMCELPKLGFECVTPCMPGQDESPEKFVGFGYPEARVVLETVKWVRTQYKKPPKIILWGVSMGGAASWLASEQDPTIDGVITEGAYARFDEAMDHWLGRSGPGASIYLKPMVWMASAMDHIDPSKIRPMDSAAKWRKPALVIQAGKDDLIALSHAQRLSEGAHCPLWIVPNATHAIVTDKCCRDRLRIRGSTLGLVRRTV